MTVMTASYGGDFSTAEWEIWTTSGGNYGPISSPARLGDVERWHLVPPGRMERGRFLHLESGRAYIAVQLSQVWVWSK